MHYLVEFRIIPSDVGAGKEDNFTMNVIVKIELQSKVKPSDKEQMLYAARGLTNALESITITRPKNEDKVLIAAFTINKAKQMDVVDKIAKSFSHFMNNYGGCAISFSKGKKIKKSSKVSNRYTQKQGQYLSFIYYYTKLNGVPPAEADFQRYFKTASSSIHTMILNLEKKGYIKREPGKSRSIELLLSRSEIPDLD